MAKTRSFGTKVYLDGIAIGGLTDVNISAGDVTNVDTTCHNTEDGFRTFVAGLKDGGSVELSGKYDYADDGQEDWREAMGDTATIYIIMPDNSGFAMKVIVGSFNATAPLDDAAEFTASAKITGEVFPVYPTMIVTGTLDDGTDPVTFPELLYNGSFSEGKPVYGGLNNVIFWENNRWFMVGGLADGNWTSTADVVTPDLVPPGEWDADTNPTGWKPTAPAIGTPTVTGS